MNKSNTYDTKSSIFSLEYKIPYDMSESSRIVEHLEESQEELQFLKLKLTEAYEKIESEIKSNIELTEKNDELTMQLKNMRQNWQAQKEENKKLKEVMKIMLENRRILEEEVDYTHARYKKMMNEKQGEYQMACSQYIWQANKDKTELGRLQVEIQQFQSSNMQIEAKERVHRKKQESLIEKIEILEHEIQKLTVEKVTQVSRLKLEIDYYQRSLTPMKKQIAMNNCRDFHEPVSEENKQNFNNIQMQTTATKTEILQSNKVEKQKQKEQNTIGKWKKNHNELNDDQKLTNCQIEKKKIEGQLVKIERLKRHTQEDRELMQDLEHQIYQIDSEISALKRKIRQKY